MSDAYPRLVLPVEWKVDAIDIAHVGRLAQLARASPLQGEGRGFESLNAHRLRAIYARMSRLENPARATTHRTVIVSSAMRASVGSIPSARGDCPMVHW